MPRKHPRLLFMLHPAKTLTKSRDCLWHSINRPDKLFGQYSLKKFPPPRTRPEFPGLPAAAHRGRVTGMQIAQVDQDMDPFSSRGGQGSHL